MNTLISVLLLSITLSLAVATAPLHNANLPKSIANQYIVVLQKNLTAEIRDAHVARVLKAGPVKLLGAFHIGSFIGYSAVMDKASLEAELEHPNVLMIEQDQTVSINADNTLTQTGATWGISRTSGRTPGATAYHYWESAGVDVDAYVIDTGIYLLHNEFTGRVTWGGNWASDGRNEDCNGHGTHVASTIGGTTYGVAKKVNLIAVKVLDCGGSGSYAGVINGIDFVTQKHRASAHKRSVANMSLGGGASDAVDLAVMQSVEAGVMHIVAGGNNADDACYYSPARTVDAITVAASTSADLRASFSNHGRCIDLYAPGNSITAGYIGSPTATAVLSGTSMAAPHVCGALAVYISHLATITPNAPRPEDAIAYLQAHATRNVITNNPVNTPNYLLYSVHSDPPN